MFPADHFMRLQGDPVDCNPPIWLQFRSMAVDPPSDFLVKILGVDTSPFLWNTRYYFTRSSL
jgi:hypothetical protein